MNRWDEIFATAHDVAAALTDDQAKRAAVADGLITLSSLMIQAVGKGVAIDGEAQMNDAEGAEAVQYHTVYLVGEQIQDSGQYVLGHATDGSYAERLERVDCFRSQGWTQ